LSTLSFQFTPQSSTSPISLNIAPYAQVWFSSMQSDSFGGQFSVSVPFTLSHGQTSALKSVSITATNSAGTSNTVVVSFTQ
jgi:hypothetical protein